MYSNTHYLGQVSFAEARAVQEEYVDLRSEGLCEDMLFCCEHPPTLSLGKRTKLEDFLVPKHELGFEVVEANRGGGPTYHGPGQLVIYPVISLRERGLGVRSFVELGLEAISTALRELGLMSHVRLEPAGVWVEGEERAYRRKKIAAVGLRIVRGVSNHGFSLNVSCDLDHFKGFSPCGIKGLEVTSVREELGAKDLCVADLRDIVILEFWKKVNNHGKIEKSSEIS